MWDAVVAELQNDFRCLRYDTRGHGASSVSAQVFEIAELADDLAALLDGVGIKAAHIAGLSLGGMTAQSFAVRHPKRVASLTLMATTAYMPTEAAWNERAALVRRRGTQVIIEPTLERWFTEGFRSGEAEALCSVQEAFCGMDPSGYASCCEAIGRMDLRPELANIKAPTTIIAGEQDPVTPVSMARALCDGIRGAKLHVLSPAAHLLAVEQPELTARYLSEASLGSS